MEDKKNKKGIFIKAAVFGSLIGAATGLLLAPKSGKELRQDLAEQVDIIGDKAIEVKNKAQSAWHNVEEKTQEKLSKSKSWFEKKKQLVSNLKKLVSEIRHGALTKTETIVEAEVAESRNPIYEIEDLS